MANWRTVGCFVLLLANCKGRQEKSDPVVAKATASPAPESAESANPEPSGLPSGENSARAYTFERFRAGFAERDISPGATLPLAGYGTYVFPFGSPRKNTAGTHDALKATAMAVGARQGRPLIVVGLDSIGLSETSVGRVRAKLTEKMGHSEFEILVAPSHSHATPDTLGLWGLLPQTGRNSEYMSFLEGALADVAFAAFEAMVPATLAQAKLNFANSSSGLDGARKDDAAVFVDVRDLQGKGLGTFTQWAAHPTVLKENNNSVSADFVGAYRYYLGQKFEGVHVYVNGAIGNVYPVAQDGVALVDDPFANGGRDADVGDGYSKAVTVGHELFLRIEGASLAPVAEPETIESCSVSFDVPVNNERFVQSVNGGVVEHALQGDNAPSSLLLAYVGPLRFASMPFETFPSVASEIRGMVSADGATVIPVGLGNDWLGYVMSDAEWGDSELGYWRDLSPSRDAARVLRDAYGRALKREGCR